MYTVIRTTRIMPGKMIEATAWAKEVAHAAERPVGGAVAVHTEVFGELNTVFWISTYPDLAAIERAFAAAGQDAEYLAAVARGIALTVPGTLNDRLLRSA